jgi:hypothetical protein
MWVEPSVAAGERAVMRARVLSARRLVKVALTDQRDGR